MEIVNNANSERLKTVLVVSWFGADAIFMVITPPVITGALSICRIFTSFVFRISIFTVLLGGEAMSAAKNHLNESKVPFLKN